MRLAVWVMVVLVLFLLVGVLPGLNQPADAAIFSSPIFILLLVVLAVQIVWCCARRMSKRRVAFILAHASILVILAGALAGSMWGHRANLPLPVDSAHGVRDIPREGRSPLPLGFTVSCIDFRVDYYEPHYNIYRPAGPDDSASRDGAEHEPFVFVRKVSVKDAISVELDDHTSVAVEDLKLGEEWHELYRAPNGWALQLARTVKHYEAELRFTGSDGATEERTLAVNHPAEYARWRFYLMDYDKERQSYIWVSARRDPGRSAVIAGIWALMVGIAALCWFEKGMHAAIDFDAEEREV